MRRAMAVIWLWVRDLLSMFFDPVGLAERGDKEKEDVQRGPTSH